MVAVDNHGAYALLITIFAMPAMIKASWLPVSPIIVVVGGAALLMALLVRSKPPTAVCSLVKACRIL